MAENTLALLQYLSSDASPIPSLTGGYTKPTTVYFSFFNSFFVQYSFQTANAMHAVLLVSSILFVIATYEPRRVTTPGSKPRGDAATIQNDQAPSHSKVTNGLGNILEDNIWIEHVKGVGILTASAVGSLFGVSFVAFIMAFVIRKPLSWFSIESSCLVLYAPAALTGKNCL